MPHEEPFTISLLEVELGSFEGPSQTVLLRTNQGEIHARLHRPENAGDAGIVWVGGAGGGLSGPARGLYPRLAQQLTSAGLTSLRVDYRRPNDLLHCTLDTLLGAAYLEGLGCSRLVLVGHSFGGAVVITAGANSEAVVGVAALSSQTYGTDAVGDLSPRALLLLHGSADEILPDRCSRLLFKHARDPKEVHLYPGCGHGLDECRAEVDRDLLNWLSRLLTSGQDGLASAAP
ncbi:alpha/beta hydrolase [Deinococcus peraridilitoris]|uniref:Phospholipase/Carboxylesterase n=1 Tax=Deinococcus peraridilitoris (strain DSM 19664 / LMG 22246 / CIP 109416 / KR-200) TaxID=937777 RepID=K9ZYW3_DEIPD|nr:phospholipase/carboxylesterase [Deinococcus peraridilitoris]AFZ66781.1 Phospholipase/Carboxylesterase [Deinococcus peraridilitoris DSM 19664]